MANPPRRGVFLVILFLMGAGWGLAFSLIKLAVSTGHKPLGLIAWQFVVMAAVLVALNALRGKKTPWRGRQVGVYLILCCLGSLVPNSLTYLAAVHLSAGMLSILSATLPLFAFPIAIALGLDRSELRRMAGILCGFGCVCLILWPELRLPEAGLTLWVLIALVPSLLYAMEGNIIGRWGPGWGLDPVQMLTGASLLGIPLTFALAALTGQYIHPIRPWGIAEWALVGAAALHAVVYATYFWTVTRAGIVFASQVSYLITGFGVLSAMIYLGERYALHIWAGLALMLLGLFLVRPRGTSGLAPGRSLQDNDA